MKKSISLCLTFLTFLASSNFTAPSAYAEEHTKTETAAEPFFSKPPKAFRGAWNINGYTGIEARIFTQNKNWPGQVNRPDFSLIFNPEFRYRSDDGNHRANFIPFLRGSTVDAERSHGDIREAYWAYNNDGLDVLAGINKEFWGVAESAHLVNIINQTDFVEDPDQEDYLGQPMIRLASQNDWGRVTAYVLPYFRERTYPGEQGRLRSPALVDIDNATYQSGAEEWHPDFAARYSHYIGEFDVGLTYFSGTSREAILKLTSEGKLRPHYEQINQIGLDLQYTNESWLWKLEAIGREGQGDSFAAFVGGFEYSFYQVMDSDIDLGLLLEYQYDGRDQDKAPHSLANNDVFAAARLAFNDTQDTEILAGFTMDHEDNDTFVNIEASTRIGQNYSAELRARFLTNANFGDRLYDFARDDYVQLRLARYF